MPQEATYGVISPPRDEGIKNKTKLLPPPPMQDWSQRITSKKCPKPSCGGAITVQYDLHGGYVTCTNGHTLVQSLEKLIQSKLDDDRRAGNMAKYEKKH